MKKLYLCLVCAFFSLRESPIQQILFIWYVLQMIFSFNEVTQRKKCPNTEFFLVHIFMYLDWIWIFTPSISVFSPNIWKYGPEKTPYLNTFHAVFSLVSSNTRIFFCNVTCLTIGLLKWGWFCFSVLPKNTTSWACLIGSQRWF